MKNFASFLPMWDLLFGTAHQPDYWPKNYGTVKFQPPETYLGQLIYPFAGEGRQRLTDDSTQVAFGLYVDAVAARSFPATW